MIETTINIDKEILNKISDAAVMSGMSRSDLIVSLLKFVMEKDIDRCEVVRAVKYQKSTDNSSWKRFHISLRYDDYEFFLDLRKFLKASVSYLVAYAVKKYLEKFIHGEITDNYKHQNYVFITYLNDGYRYWQIIWGYPPNMEKKYPLE